MKIDPGPLPGPVRGFRFSGVHGGLKPRGRRDLALIVADRPAVCAAVFTANRAAAAPVVVAREHIASGLAQAVMINSGSANAATGEKGLTMARWGCRELAARLSTEPEMVLPCSTGVIGVQLERVPFARAISLAVDGLSKNGFGAAARAMMTSDAFPKWSQQKIRLGDTEVTVAGMAKGAGMIHPNMATMLSFLTTDAAVDPGFLQQTLSEAVDETFNMVTVDGDSSTNDTVLLLANGEAGNAPLHAGSPGASAFVAALRALSDHMCKELVRDAEGSAKIFSARVEGAASREDARLAARAIAASSLVKAAIHGNDPNWGRVIAAVGYSGAEIDVAKVRFDINDVVIMEAGSPISFHREAVIAIMNNPEVYLTVNLGLGDSEATAWGCELTEEYVVFNSAYTT